MQTSRGKSFLPERIAIVHEYGANRHFESLLWLARNKGIEVKFCNLDFARRLAKSVLGLRMKPAVVALSDAVQFIKLLFARDLTIIMGLAPFNTWIVLLLWLKRRNRIIYYSSWPRWNLQEVVHHPGNRYLESVWKRALDGIDAVGVSMAATEELRRFGARAQQIPHSVDTSRFAPPVKRSSAEQVRILFVGRLVAEKGVELLLELAKRLRSNRVEWVFAGEGSLRGRLCAAQAEGLPITLLGFVGGRQLIEAYQQADVFVLPSYAKAGWEELFGISLIEAMSTGLPAVSTDCVGPREIISEGVEGFIVPQGNVEQLSAALHSLIIDGPIRELMGKRARSEAVERYSIPVVASLWEQVLVR